MNKKAIATQAIVIIVVLFFVIIITTGILSWLALTTTNQKSLEINAEHINQGTLLRTFLRTPIKGTDMNMAEFIISYNKEEVEANTINIKQLFLEIQILDDKDNILFTIEGTQKRSSDEIELEQVIPNYVGEYPPYYRIKMQEVNQNE